MLSDLAPTFVFVGFGVWLSYVITAACDAPEPFTWIVPVVIGVFLLSLIVRWWIKNG